MAATAKKTRKPSTERADAYQLVTDRIIEALEAGRVPWHQPWRQDTAGRPMSLSMRKPYNGINVFVLSATAYAKGYESPWWGTYRQIAERGGQVRKGEKGTPVVFWRIINKKDPATGETADRIFLLKHFTVFNADQCDNLVTPEIDKLADHDPIESCETVRDGYLVRAHGLRLNHGGDAAYYSPGLDQVQMPRLGQFETPEHYYGTLFHEFAHSTAHESRLNRKDAVHNRFGDESYAKEELVAEMTAAFVCGEAGIDVNVPHRAGYIQSWINALRGDKKLVVGAGGAAQKAADLILGRDRAAEDDTLDQQED